MVVLAILIKPMVRKGVLANLVIFQVNIFAQDHTALSTGVDNDCRGSLNFFALRKKWESKKLSRRRVKQKV
jgi:hypothetical protein